MVRSYLCLAGSVTDEPGEMLHRVRRISPMNYQRTSTHLRSLQQTSYSPGAPAVGRRSPLSFRMGSAPGRLRRRNHPFKSTTTTHCQHCWAMERSILKTQRYPCHRLHRDYRRPPPSRSTIRWGLRRTRQRAGR